jgi:predicted amidophosphoribosyltransferase
VTGALVVGTALALTAMAIVLYPLFFPAEDEAGSEPGAGCSRCGERLPAGARFCASCGAPVDHSSARTT